MKYNIKYGRSAEKNLDSQPKSVQRRIMDAIDDLPAGDVRKLQGREGYRLTRGGFRVLFDYIDDKQSLLAVMFTRNEHKR